jgi:hypothetical protein
MNLSHTTYRRPPFTLTIFNSLVTGLPNIRLTFRAVYQSYIYLNHFTFTSKAISFRHNTSFSSHNRPTGANFTIIRALFVDGSRGCQLSLCHRTSDGLRRLWAPSKECTLGLILCGVRSRRKQRELYDGDQAANATNQHSQSSLIQKHKILTRQFRNDLRTCQ